MISCASQCDITNFLKLSLTNSYHIVLAIYGVRYDCHFILDVLYKKFTKIIDGPS